MGMFDWVKFEMSCPVCGSKISDFQSKSGERVLENVEFWEVDNFYSSCDNCDTWVEFDLKNKARKKYKISDYKMKIEKGEISRDTKLPGT